jgi:hypothetical protein
MKLKRVRGGIAFGNTRKENFLFNLRIRSLKEFLRYFSLRLDGSCEVQMLLLARHIHTHTYTHTHTHTHTVVEAHVSA